MACSSVKHFHVICADVFEVRNLNEIFEVADANSALEAMIQALPDDWEGSIEVRDDKTLGDRNFPLIDFWRTPISK
jgi:hypothetical protein